MTKSIYEFARMVTIFLVLGSLLGAIIKLIFASINIKVDGTAGGWLASFAVLLFVYVLYKNVLPCSEFKEGEQRLSISITLLLLFCSVMLLVITPFFC